MVEDQLRLPAAGVPNAGCSVLARRDDLLSVRAEAGGPEPSPMANERGQESTGLGVPHFGDAAGACGDGLLAVWGEAGMEQDPCRVLDGEQLPSRQSVPDSRGAVVARGQHARAILTEFRALDGVWLFEGVQLRSPLEVPQLCTVFGRRDGVRAIVA